MWSPFRLHWQVDSLEDDSPCKSTGGKERDAGRRREGLGVRSDNKPGDAAAESSMGGKRGRDRGNDCSEGVDVLEREFEWGSGREGRFGQQWREGEQRVGGREEGDRLSIEGRRAEAVPEKDADLAKVKEGGKNEKEGDERHSKESGEVKDRKRDEAAGSGGRAVMRDIENHLVTGDVARSEDGANEWQAELNCISGAGGRESGGDGEQKDKACDKAWDEEGAEEGDVTPEALRFEVRRLALVFRRGVPL